MNPSLWTPMFIGQFFHYSSAAWNANSIFFFLISPLPSFLLLLLLDVRLLSQVKELSETSFALGTWPFCSWSLK